MQNERQKEIAGSWATFVWIGSGLYLYLSTEGASLFSLSALLFIVLGMFAAAITFGAAAYAIQHGIAKLLARIVRTPSRGITVSVSTVGLMLFIAQTGVVFLAANWVFQRVAAPTNAIASAEEESYPPILSRVEEHYIGRLRQWTTSGGDPATVQEHVIEPCSKLLLLTATDDERQAFLANGNMDEYDFRASFCMKATVNVVHAQPEFQQREMIQGICSQGIRFFRIICSEFRLVE